MRFIFSSLLCLFCALSINAQKEGPVQWKFNVQSDGYSHTISATAEIDDSWVVYSNYTDEGGPIPTSLIFDNETELEKVGEVVEKGQMIKMKSELFGIDVAKFENTVTLVQTVKTKPGMKEIKGHLRFMTCDGTRCLPPKDIPFRFALD